MPDDLYKKMILRAVRGLKVCGPFHYRPGDEPNPLDCTLAGRVSHVFLTGMTSAIQLCREAGEDPDFREDQTPVCCMCPNDAECVAADGSRYCGDCCLHEGDGYECSSLECST